MGALSSGFYHDETTAQAAERLAAAIKLYGPDIADLRYQQETSVIASILDDFTVKPELAAALVTLHLGAWVAHLGTVNTEFDGVYVQRSQQMAGDPRKVLALRAALTAAWETLKQYLQTHATLTPPPPSSRRRFPSSTA